MSAESLRIVHLASLARSGETLMLRTLTAHPAIHVVHDLHPTNTGSETRLFQLLRVWPGTTLPRAAAGPDVPRAAQVLLIKQGVFALRSRYDGFALLRNPYASFCSLWSYDARLAGRPTDAATNRRNWERLRLCRLIAWADACVPALVPAILAESDPVRQFLLFWRARSEQIVRQCSTVVHYEDFTDDPERELRRICVAAGLPFDAALLHAEQRFRPGQIGHGGIDLGRPIRATPAWSPDPLVPIEPFVRAVADGPVPAYRHLYDKQGAHAALATC